MPLNDDKLRLVMLLIQTTSLTGEELEEAWDLFREIELFLWETV